MIQQILALLVVVVMLIRLFWQRGKKHISNGEFIFWLIFWVFAGVLIGMLKWIDGFVDSLGFSGTGIDFLLYIAIAILFYFIFRIRLRLEKLEEQITKLVQTITIKDFKNKK